MAQQSYANEGAYDVQVTGMSLSLASFRGFYVRIGGALWRIIQEYRDVGFPVSGTLPGQPTLPSVMLPPMDAMSRGSLVPALTSAPWQPDPTAPVNWRWLSAQHDKSIVCVAWADATRVVADGADACPELRTWCEAFGGTYTDLV